MLDFDEIPFAIKRATRVLYLHPDEGTIDFLVNLKLGEPPFAKNVLTS